MRRVISIIIIFVMFGLTIASTIAAANNNDKWCIMLACGWVGYLIGVRHLVGGR